MQKIKETKANLNAKIMKNFFTISYEDQEKKVVKQNDTIKQNILLNQSEIDYRFTLSEIVNDYPFVTHNTQLSKLKTHSMSSSNSKLISRY